MAVVNDASALSTASTNAVRFLLKNRIVEVSDVAPTTTILNFLRQSLGRMGTKEGCAEGDCGACTVVTGELKNGEVELKAVNACIQFVPTLNGKALFTVEDLRGGDGSLHPVQEAMRDCHGSQCGFCTPGFVMSLWALYLESTSKQSHITPGESEIRQAITGNLCRCTGYRPIIDAGKRMCALPKVAFDSNQLKGALKALESAGTSHYHHGGASFYSPRTLAELTTLRTGQPSATLLAGGTDVGLWVNKSFREIGDIIYTGEVAELKTISGDEGGLTIGAAVSLNDAYAVVKKSYPEMNEMWERFASTPIRNAGTLGGNIANGSPIGDSMPALIAVGAEVTLASVGGLRRLALEDLYIAYQKKAMQPNEVVAYIHVPAPAPEMRFRTYKLSKRFDSDISAVCAAFMISLDGDTISSCRIAFGGMAATPRRATLAEGALLGNIWDEATARRGMQALGQDYAPLSDMRASAGYRLKSAQNLLYRFFLETRPVDALRNDELNVFA
ncbi:MAG: xanthine dehydrogenase small subunit [Betaproteobacteria bacterium]